jgi:deoxyribonuclease-4
MTENHKNANDPMPRPLIGAQISAAGGFAPVPERAQALGCEAVQVFSSNPRMWRTRTPSMDELHVLVAGLREYRLPLFLHTIYLINLATPDEDLRRRSSEALAHSLVLGALIGAAGVVTHVGSHRGEGSERGVAWVAEAISAAVDAAHASLAEDGREHNLPPLLLETGLGAGNSLGGSPEQLAAILAEMPSGAGRPPFGVCIDTAHLFAAGYPIHESAGLQAFIEQLSGLRLLDRLDLVHLNDSATPFGSRRDQHANPGAGHIGHDGLAGVVRHPALAHVPFVLETPGLEGHGPDAANVAVVKAMRAAQSLSSTEAPPAPPSRPLSLARDASRRATSASPAPGARRRPADRQCAPRAACP